MTMNKNKINKHGGRRAGAGRPALPIDERMITRSFKIRKADWERANQIAEMRDTRISTVLRNAVARYIEREGNND